jgi:putative two-component system response regulator
VQDGQTVELDSMIFDSKILIVDDLETNTILLEKMLGFSGYRATRTLNTSKDFFDVFLEYKPDLVLLDLMMPEIDGFDILKWMRSEENNLKAPAIVITAQNDNESKISALTLGAQDFITKPLDKTEVVTRIGNLLRIRTLNKQLVTKNLDLEIKVFERTSEIERVQMEVIERLMRAAEFRDQDTGDHILRMSLYVYHIAKKLGYSEKEAVTISTASKMHDIGKIGIPDGLLLKPRKLDEIEMKLMREHSTKGARILANSKYELIQVAEQIAQSHHEKWDGSGYPDGLIGAHIPLVARIAAVADVFDALVSRRAYKAAWSFDSAVEQIKSQTGIHFDPQVVEAFCSSLDTIQQIAEGKTQVVRIDV